MQLPPEQVKALMERARAGEELTVDLEARTAGGFPFELDDFARECLLEGLDDIGLTLRNEADLAAYEACPPGADLDARARVAPARAPSGSRTRRPLQALSAALLSAFSSRSAAASPTVHGVFESTALLTGLLLPR